MADDLDMMGGGGLEGTRASPTHAGSSQEQGKTQRDILYRDIALSDSQQETTSAQSSTHADSIKTRAIPAIDGFSTNEKPSPTPSIAVSLQDGTIKCSCPPGTVRFGIDFEVTTVNGVPVNLHKPCMRSNSLNPAHVLPKTGKSTAAAAASRTNAERLAAKLLGRDASAEQRLKLQHFTSTFRCDGPCSGSTKIDDYLVCKKCYAWQHKPCMLYGEDGDAGGPTCNCCFMTYLAQSESTVKWPRERRVQAVREAWKLFMDPANQHQVSHRAHARRFLAAFFVKNRAFFVKFVAARKKADQRATGMPQSVDDGYPQTEVGQHSQTTHLRRSMSMTQPSPSAASGDGLDDLEELDRRMYASDDDVSTVDNDGALQDNNSSTETSSPQKFVSADDNDDALMDITTASAASTPRKVSRAYVEAHKHERNFHHRGKKTFLEGLPALNANIKSAVYGPGAEQWRVDAKAYQQAGKAKARSLKADVRATLSANMPRPNPTPARKKPVPTQQNLAGAAFPNLKPSAARLKPIPSSQATKAAKRKRVQSPEESTTSIADPKTYRSSARRKSAPATAPRKYFPPPESQMDSKVDVHESCDEDTIADDETTANAQPPYDKIACKCKDIDRSSHTDCFKCIECGASQHKGCHDDDSGPRPAQCNFCFNSTPTTKRSIEVEVALTITSGSSPETISAATRIAKATRSVQINGVDEYLDSFRDAVSQESLLLAKTTLWKTWCIAPSPGQAFTEPPVYPAEPPEDWLEEMRARVEALLHAAGREKSLYYLQPVLRQWPRNDLEVMTAIRDLTLEVLHRGAYKRKGGRGELGVLAEVVGIEEKGWAWKGKIV
ncbi:hypothetical protein DOTSEDRAFT_57378 [Dothistroma septosporum NZE10]|uniref:Uncharacterized protein n=1 Tax=Dothistroma septosporum (strain NZE10 / CBS 128990) TaxID=675120 RepID=N1PCU4_DOTSN|nr:hypothetical protein DOTSEDRAFT_57378 [Dothistroma septosporum NZE10]